VDIPLFVLDLVKGKRRGWRGGCVACVEVIRAGAFNTFFSFLLSERNRRLYEQIETRWLSLYIFFMFHYYWDCP
jgi:hypothetical protein